MEPIDIHFHALIEFSPNNFQWIQWIKTKSNSSMVTRDTPYLTTDTFPDVVVKKCISITVSAMVSIHSGESKMEMHILLLRTAMYLFLAV